MLVPEAVSSHLLLLWYSINSFAGIWAMYVVMTSPAKADAYIS